MPTPDDDVTYSDIVARIENSPYAELLHDESALERTLIELMAASEHPVLAEMGQELSPFRSAKGWSVAGSRGVLRPAADRVGWGRAVPCTGLARGRSSWPDAVSRPELSDLNSPGPVQGDAQSRMPSVDLVGFGARPASSSAVCGSRKSKRPKPWRGDHD